MSVPSVPRWLTRTVAVLVGSIVGFGVIGLAAAVAGAFSLLVVAPIGAIATVGFLRLDPARWSAPAPQMRRSDHLAAVLVVVFVATTGAYSLRHGAEHLEINRDPGFYVNAAKWIERDGSLAVDVDAGAFAGVEELDYETPGLPEPEPGTLHFQGNHLLPALMAIGAEVGGDAGLFGTPIVLASVALLAVYVLLASRTSAWPALAMTTALGGSVLWIAFARDAYTEVPSLALVAFALTLVPISGGIPRPGAAAQIGVCLGALCALRIDAPLLLMLWPIVMAGWWFAADTDRDPDRARAAAASAARALVGGFAATALVAALDLFLRSPRYLDEQGARALMLWLGLTIVAGAGAAATAIPTLRSAVQATIARASAPRARAVAAAGLVAGSGALWLVRPAVQTVRGTPQRAVADLQALLGLPVDITRKYSEHSFAWQAWYLGAPLVVLAIGGLAYALVARGLTRRLAPALLTAAPATMLYLHSPNIFPDHTWVMRRFLTTLTLALLLGGAVALDALLRARFGRRPVVLAGVALLAAGTVAVPLWSAKPVRAGADQRGFPTAVRAACDALGPDAAVIVVEDDADALYKRVPQALRGWCGASVALADPALDPATRRNLTDAWAERDRPLFVLAGTPERAARLCPGATPVTFRAENRFLIEQTLTHLPRGYSSQSLEFVLMPAKDCDRPAG